MTTLCLCDWVDVSEDWQRQPLPIKRAAPLSSERERVIVLTRIEGVVSPRPVQLDAIAGRVAQRRT